MTTALTCPEILIWFGLNYSTGDVFTIGDPVKGVIGNTTYLIASNDGNGVDVNAGDDRTLAVSVRRGRDRELDEFTPGRAEIVLENYDRKFDPLNTAGPYYGDLAPGKRITVAFRGAVVFTGVVEGWECDWPARGEGMPTARVTAVDELGQLARKEFDAWTTTAGQTSGQRMEAILNRPEVAFGANRSVDTGLATLQSDNVTWGANVLNYAQLVAASERGRLYASRTGQLTFDDRHSLVGAAVDVAFRDDGTGVDFHGVMTENGAELWFNRVGVDRENGLLQTVEAADAEDKGYRSLSLTGLLMDSDAQSLALATHLLSIYSTPAARISSITVLVDDVQPAYRGPVSALDMGSLIWCTWTPYGVGSAVTQTLAVEGVDHSWSAGAPHVMTLRTSPASQQAVFIIGDPVRGVIGNTDYLIAY